MSFALNAFKKYFYGDGKELKWWLMTCKNLKKYQCQHVMIIVEIKNYLFKM